MTDNPIPAEALRTYLACPRRYELQHRHGLERGERPDERHLSICRAAILAGLGAVADPLETARERFDERWGDHEGAFHSSEQRAHARRVRWALVESYLTGHGRQVRAGIDDLPAAVSPIAPSLETAISVPEGEPCRVSLPVDALSIVDGDLVGIRFVRYRSRLGVLRYYDEWEGRVEERFRDHFDPGADQYDVATAATLLETAAVLEGLRDSAEDTLCRYVLVPLLDDGAVTVNVVDGGVEAAVEPVDCTAAYLDHATFGRTHEHRNDTVDRRLTRLVARIRDGLFDPSERWPTISDRECPRCSLSVCCEDHIAHEVAFDG